MKKKYLARIYIFLILFILLISIFYFFGLIEFIAITISCFISFAIIYGCYLSGSYWDSNQKL